MLLYSICSAGIPVQLSYLLVNLSVAAEQPVQQGCYIWSAGISVQQDYLSSRALLRIKIKYYLPHKSRNLYMGMHLVWLRWSGDRSSPRSGRGWWAGVPRPSSRWWRGAGSRCCCTAAPPGRPGGLSCDPWWGWATRWLPLHKETHVAVILWRVKWE